MSNRFFASAFALGLAAVLWVGSGFVGSSWLALAMTVAIGAAYLLGAWELVQYRRTTAALGAAVAGVPQPLADLAAWLERVPASLRDTVRLRIEGERVALPGPALTPYLVGLLVMLGMLGTFLGMVITFKGAVFALEGSTDLQAIRAALAAPIKGLGLSFGTSVAGVAASAMLGLMSALSRRERLDAGRQLDGRIATVLLPFSRVHQRQETLRVLQAQGQALPQVCERLDALMERIEQRGQQLDEQLLARQARFQDDATLAYRRLADSVGASLQDSLAAGAQAAGDSIRPVVASAMAQVVQESQRSHGLLGELSRQQVDTLSQRFGDTASTVTHGWTAALDQQARSNQALADGLQQALASFAQTFEQRSAALLAGVKADSAALRDDESRRGDQAVQQLGTLQAVVTQHLATLGTALEAPLTRLLHTAAEVPQAAAGVITELRQEMSRVAERDNHALRERSVLLEQLDALLRGVNAAAGDQRSAIEAMVASAASVLATQAGRAADVADQVAASAVEVASLAEALGQSMALFQASNDKLADSLLRVEASLQRSTARSDEQLAYYVAQAREVIDLSIASQQGLVENMRQLRRPTAGAPG
jgi:intracellular sulfur oxidation DsrE/DsrF family protein